jgi:hypothetical protein
MAIIDLMIREHLISIPVPNQNVFPAIYSEPLAPEVGGDLQINVSDWVGGTMDVAE